MSICHSDWIASFSEFTSKWITDQSFRQNVICATKKTPQFKCQEIKSLLCSGVVSAASDWQASCDAFIWTNYKKVFALISACRRVNALGATHMRPTAVVSERTCKAIGPLCATVRTPALVYRPCVSARVYLYACVNKTHCAHRSVWLVPNLADRPPPPPPLEETGQFSLWGVLWLLWKRRWRFPLVPAWPVNGACLLPSITGPH